MIRSLFEKIFRRREVWSIGIFRLPSIDDLPNLQYHEPIATISDRSLSFDRNYRYIIADPFAIVVDGVLHVFYEGQTYFDRGRIYASSIEPDGRTTHHGTVLTERWHLSYPNVFALDGTVWMIPEGAGSGAVWLYRTTTFPTGWERVRVLIDEPLVDVSVLVRDGHVFLLGTSRRDQLRIFCGKSPTDEFVPCPVETTSDPQISRNAGNPVQIAGTTYRLAQNCSVRYGENVVMLAIDEISPTTYREHIARDVLFTAPKEWMALGHHHVSVAFDGEICFAAVDGYCKDSYEKTLRFLAAKTCDALRRRLGLPVD